MRRENFLDKYWEEKLHIKYKEEVEKYKKICCINYKKKYVYATYPQKYELISYKEWQQNILCTISILDAYEAMEYSKYLNLKCRYYETKFNLGQTIFVPLIFCLVPISYGPLVNSIEVIDGMNSSNLYFTFLLLVYILFGFLLKILTNQRKVEKTTKYFFEDMKEIVDIYMESLNQTTNL